METVSRFNFLEDAIAYRAMQAMWQSIFDKITEQAKLTYRPYLKSDYREGELYSNGNPIFTAMVETIGRGVRIIQDNQVEDADQYISGWMDDITDFDGVPDLDELVIPLILSEETKAIAETLIRAWLVEQVDKETMQKILDEKAILATD